MHAPFRTLCRQPFDKYPLTGSMADYCFWDLHLRTLWGAGLRLSLLHFLIIESVFEFCFVGLSWSESYLLDSIGLWVISPGSMDGDLADQNVHKGVSFQQFPLPALLPYLESKSIRRLRLVSKGFQQEIDNYLTWLKPRCLKVCFHSYINLPTILWIWQWSHIMAHIGLLWAMWTLRACSRHIHISAFPLRWSKHG